MELLQESTAGKLTGIILAWFHCPTIASAKWSLTQNSATADYLKFLQNARSKSDNVLLSSPENPGIAWCVLLMPPP